MNCFKFLFILCLLLVGCSDGGPKAAFLQAEGLWDQGKYRESLVAFDQLAARDLDEGLSDQARFRAAQIALMNIKDFPDARRRLELYVIQGQDPIRKRQADSALGAVLFDSMNDYPGFLKWIERVEQTKAFEITPEQRLKKGLAHMYLRAFDLAFQEFARLERENPATPWATEAAYRIAENQMLGARTALETQKALEGFKRVLALPGGDQRAGDIEANMATCLEDLGKWHDAMLAWQKIEKHGGRNVGTAKVHQLRIEQRLKRQGAYDTPKK